MRGGFPRSVRKRRYDLYDMAPAWLVIVTDVRPSSLLNSSLPNHRRNNMPNGTRCAESVGWVFSVRLYIFDVYSPLSRALVLYRIQ